MTTLGKIAIGAAVVAGGFLVYKIVSGPTPAQVAARKTATPQKSVVDGFLGLATSITGYFTKPNPSLPAVPAVHGGGGSWDSGSDLLAPLSPGESAWADSTANDYLLS